MVDFGPAKKAIKKAATKQVAKGQPLVCEVCGLSVVVDEVCGCVETHEIICCGTPMKTKAVKVKPAAKK